MKRLLSIPIIILLLVAQSCKDDKKEEVTQKEVSTEMNKQPFFKLSLAQWSLNKNVRFKNK